MIKSDNISKENIIYKEGLDVNKSLIDQILNLKSIQNKNNSNSIVKKLEEEEIVNQKNNIRKRSYSLSRLPMPVKTNASVHSHLEKLGATIVPFDLFEHVINSLKNYLKLNIKIEYLYDTEKKLYWFAIIKHTHGNLLYLKFLVPKLNNSCKNEKVNELANETGSQEKREDNHDDQNSTNEDEDDFDDDDENSEDREKLYFFYLLNQKEQRIKPVGWCRNNDCKIKIPDFIYEKLKQKYNQQKIIEKINNKVTHLVTTNVNRNLMGNFFERLTDVNIKLAPNLTTKCVSQLRPNQILELQDFKMPSNVWFVRILENIGGRLLLEYYFEDATKNLKFWLFYLDTHLHHVGWAKNNDYSYKLPVDYENLVLCDVKNVVEKVLNNPGDLDTVNGNILVNDLFKNQQKFPKSYTHRFQIGHMIEVLYENKFYVAHIVELLKEYFKVKLHTNNEIYVYFTPTSQHIFPIKWCEQNMLNLELPNKWPKEKGFFNWDEYIVLCNKKSELPENFYVGADQSLFSLIISRHLTNICEKYKVGFYLECVNPLRPNEICIGQIKLRVKHLLFIKIFSNSSEENAELYIFTQNSFDLFPCGWCEMNEYKNFVLPSHFNVQTSFSNNNCKDGFRSDSDKIPYLMQFNGKFIFTKKKVSFQIQIIYFRSRTMV